MFSNPDEREENRGPDRHFGQEQCRSSPIGSTTAMAADASLSRQGKSMKQRSENAGYFVLTATVADSVFHERLRPRLRPLSGRHRESIHRFDKNALPAYFQQEATVLLRQNPAQQGRSEPL